MARLSLVDYAFLALETAESPKHVAGLLLFELPDNAEPRFLSNLFESFRSSRPVPPFNQKLQRSLGVPTWTDDANIDMRYHVTRHVLPEPGDRRQLVDLVSKLHEDRLERSRPMWQFHLIEGLAGGERFACYFKIHHAYMDGAKMSARLARVLNRSAEEDAITPIWSADLSRPKSSRPAKGLAARLRGMTTHLTDVPELLALNLSHVPQALGITKGDMAAPFSAPKTLLNRPLTSSRALASVDLPLATVRDIAKAQGVKVNDVLLELCDGALRAYFAKRRDPATQALVAQVPISLREARGHETGNQITIALIELATTEPDRLARLRQIAANSARVKKRFAEVSGTTAQNYTVLWNTVAEALDLAGLTGRTRPLGNIVISNLPGPQEQLYLGGAPFRALYPISTMAPGTALNITIYTYAGQMHFGIVAGSDAIRDPERLTRSGGDVSSESKHDRNGGTVHHDVPADALRAVGIVRTERSIGQVEPDVEAGEKPPVSDGRRRGPCDARTDAPSAEVAPNANRNMTARKVESKNQSREGVHPRLRILLREGPPRAAGAQFHPPYSQTQDRVHRDRGLAGASGWPLEKRIEAGRLEDQHPSR